MKYTRKDISELLATVNGAPDVFGYANSTTSTCTTVGSSGPCTYLICNSTCEDGMCPSDDTYCGSPPPPPRC
jgi:hypothetical protein